MSKQDTTVASRFVIESADRLPLIIRMRDFILTLLVWIMYVFFMRAFFAFLWDVGTWVYHGFANTDGYDSFKQVSIFVTYFEIIVVLSIIFIGWSVYNIVRYGKMTRRRPGAPLSIEQIAAKAHVSPEDLEEWQRSKIVIMHHDAKGRLVDIVQK